MQVSILKTTSRVEKSMHKLRWIDSLRALAILGVILSHTLYLAVPGRGEIANPWPLLHPLVVSFINAGQHGVQLFFVASAFTLFSSHANRRLESHAILKYFLRRLFRIAPLYYVGLLYYTCWHQAVDNFSATQNQLLANLFFVHGLTPHTINLLVPGSWSISAEMMFYCIVPILTHYIRSVNGAVWFILATLWINGLIQILLTKMHLSGYSEEISRFRVFFLPNQLPIFGLGILLYFLYKQQGPVQIPSGTLVACFATICLGFIFNNTDLFLMREHFLFSIGFIFLALGLSKHTYMLLINPFFSFIGEISFSLYLVHFGVLFAAQYFNIINIISPVNGLFSVVNVLIRFVIVVAVSCVIAYATYHLIEVPGQQIGKRIIKYLS